ncbi:MAG TPA: galactokinase [Chloroflexota bacterium]|nr:galactokinase [Chloroflexota bacterium]
MREVERRALEAYRAQFGEDPVVLASAPGRVNLIGEHTDYNEGFVLPCAIGRRVAVAAGRGEGRLYSTDYAEMRALSDRREGVWSDYPSGVLWALRDAGAEALPFRAAFAGDVPQGAGLSSSAAIEAATGLALDTLFQLQIPRRKLATLCQRAENAFVGVNSGIMDQYASLLCEAGACLLIDCRSLDATSVPLDLSSFRLSLLVCDTRVERSLAATGYNERRATCEAAARALGVASLRDASLDDLQSLSGLEQQRARHVVTENMRVLDAVQALDRDDFGEFGRLLFASHASLADDYGVSTQELDRFVAAAAESGALGARLTGAGFGGSAIALVPEDRVDSVQATVAEEFTRCGYRDPVFYTFRPVAGAEIVN